MSLVEPDLTGGEGEAVVLVFIYARRRPRSPAEFDSLAPTTQQMPGINLALRLLETPRRRVFRAATTNRRKRIDSHEEFKAALALAQRLNCSLIIGDLFGALRFLELSEAAACLGSLMRADVPIFDAMTGRSLSDMTPEEITSRSRSSIITRMARGQRIKKGITVQPGDRQARARVRRRAGQKPMKAAAHRLRETIAIIEAELGGRTLTPTVLAKELNERGEVAARGGPWSRSSADRLLREYRGLPAPH